MKDQAHRTWAYFTYPARRSHAFLALFRWGSCLDFVEVESDYERSPRRLVYARGRLIPNSVVGHGSSYHFDNTNDLDTEP
jgi:hypothetical protein